MCVDWCCNCDLGSVVIGVSCFEISFLAAMAGRVGRECVRRWLGFVCCANTASRYVVDVWFQFF